MDDVGWIGIGKEQHGLRFDGPESVRHAIILAVFQSTVRVRVEELVVVGCILMLYFRTT